MRRRAKTEINRLLDKADSLLQDYYRLYCHNLGIKCMGCGGEMQLGHHFYNKSKSAYTRYLITNLCPLCSSCHSRHHLSGDPSIVANILKAKGMAWYNKLHKTWLEHKGEHLDTIQLQKEITKWTKKIEQEKPTPDESVL